MAIIGQLGTFNQTVGVVVDMDDMVDILPVDDVPLQRWIPNGRPATEVKVEWLNEALTGQTVTVNTTSATGSTTIVLNSGEGDLVRAGDILRLDTDNGNTTDLQVTVDSAPSGDTLTVTRPFASTTDSQLVAGDTLTIIGQYRDEGSDPEDGRSVDRSTDYNYTEIDQEKVEATRTTRKIKRYGMGDPYAHEVSKKFRELAIRYERRLVLGRRVQSSKKRAMGGLLYYATTAPTSAAKATFEADINSALKTVWNAGGQPRDIFCSADVKGLFDALNDSRVRTSASDTTYQGQVDHFSSSFGSVNIHFSRYIPKRKALILTQEYVSHRTLDGYQHELLAKTGDADKGQIICEKSLELRNPAAHNVVTVTDL